MGNIVYGLSWADGTPLTRADTVFPHTQGAVFACTRGAFFPHMQGAVFACGARPDTVFPHTHTYPAEQAHSRQIRDTALQCGPAWTRAVRVTARVMVVTQGARPHPTSNARNAPLQTPQPTPAHRSSRKALNAALLAFLYPWL